MAYTTINKSSEHFNTKLYTGTGSSNAVTGVNFRPDLVWIKNRVRAEDHAMFDAVRGSSGGYYGKIRSNSTAAQEYDGNGMSAIGSDGFTVLDQDQVNRSGDTYASWNWKANGAGSANTDGTISSTVSANTTSGFSIVKYTGTGSNATVGHGLGAAPKMVIVRRISPGGEWYIHAGQLNDNEKVLVLNTTAANANASTVFNNTAPTSSVFSLGTNGDANGNTYEHIAYCFAEKTGYSKFGSYTGNGSTDGTFVYTGFKPAFVIFKRTNSTGNWQLLDNKRLGYNPENRTFYPNSNIAEQNEDDADLLSNGFKLKSTGGDSNISGGQYIYMAFAEAPLVGTNNVPCTAR